MRNGVSRVNPSGPPHFLWFHHAGPSLPVCEAFPLSQKHQAPSVPAHIMHPALLVGLGGALGSIARWCVSEFIPTTSDAEVPWATIAVNLLGAFLMGVVLASAMQTETLLFIGTGLLGGFTTMSTFGVETVRLIQAQSTSAAVVYVLLNLLAPVAAWAGWRLSEAAIS
ncbi:MAG: fluoride efflux transporter CrcB [Methanobacteriota archaeon]|nr:MAG: fluoride efflux transporter CrcB [Euryarchaeota archaeon]